MTQIDPSLYVSFVTGILLPFLIAFIRAHYASRRYVALLAFVVCLVAAVLTMFLTRAFIAGQPLNAADYARLYLLNAIAVTMTAWQTYSRLWQPLGVIEPIERSGPQLGNTVPPAPTDTITH